MLDWDDLRFFREVARLGSLSAASRTLGTDHTTVARRVSGLEEALGLKLFDRLPRGYVLTAEGEAVLERSAPVEEAVFAIRRLAGGLASAIEGTVRLSGPPAFASAWLVPRLAPLLERHPGLVLDVIGETAAADLGRHDADLAVRLSRPSGEGLVVRRLGSLGYGLYGHRAYLARVPEDERRFLGYDDSLASSPQERWLRAIKGTRPSSLVSNDLASLVAATRAGMGVAALPHALAADWPELICLRDGPEATRPIWLVVHPDLRRAPRVRAVMDHLVAITEPLRRATPDDTEPAGA